MALSDLAFKTTFKPYRRLEILGQAISNSLIKSMSDLTAELDYPKLTNFNIGNVSVTLIDEDGEFNPNNPNNFWTTNWARVGLPEHYNQVGFKGRFEVYIGYDRDGTIESEKVFDGEVADITVNLNPPEVVVRAIDTSQSLRPTTIFDFGIARKVVLPERTDNRNYGEYPFPPQSIPSEKSIEAITTPGRDAMTDVGTIGIEGETDPLNYQVENNVLQTEGGVLASGNKPETTFNDVYRYKRVDTLINKLLTHHNVVNSDIEILPQTTEAHFSSNGRPGWELENLSTDLARQWRFRGYVKDVVYDSTNDKFYMLYGQKSTAVPDRIISYDVATDTWERVATTTQTIAGVTYQCEFWQLATADFSTFYVLATVGLDSQEGLRVYDVLEGSGGGQDSPIVILKYESGTWTVADDWNSNKPQIGFHYSAFAAPPDVRFGTDRYPMLPDTRTSFVVKEIAGEDELVYRSATGVNTYRLSDGTKASLKSIPLGSRRTYDFWIGDTDATTFFAWIEYGTDTSTLRIDDGSGTAIIDTTYADTPNTFISDQNAYLLNYLQSVNKGQTGRLITVSDMIYHNGYLYAVLQITYGSGIAATDSAGALIQVDVSNNTLTIKKLYENFLHAARSPVVENDKVYYFEGSHYQYRADVGALDYPDNTGHLIEVLEGTPLLNVPAVVDKGLSWRSTYRDPVAFEADLGFGQHGGTASPMLSDGDAIHLWAGYGDVEQLQYAPAEDIAEWFDQYPVNDVENWQWLQYGTEITQRIPVFETNGQNAWDRMTALAELVNNTVSYRSGRFEFLPRLTKQTTLRLELADTTTSLAAVVDAGRFPTSGMVLINDELIAYQSKSADNSDIESLTRGAEGSQAATHGVGDQVLFIDALVFNHADKQNLGSLNWSPDFTNIYNKLTAQLIPVTGEAAPVVVESEDSIAANDERTRSFNLRLLSAHESPWAKLLLSQYLVEMQQAQFEVELMVPWSPHLRVGQTLVVDQQVVAHLRFTPVRILRLSHNFSTRQTRVIARTFGERRISAPFGFSASVESHLRYVVNVAITPVTLPAAVGGVGTITYSLSQLPTGLDFDASTRTISGAVGAEETRLMTYTATDSSTVPQTATLTFRITSVGGLVFTDIRPSNLVFRQNCYVDHELDEAIDGVEPVRYRIVGLPEPIAFDARTRRLTGLMPLGISDIEYTAVDDAGNTASQTFDLVGESIPSWRAILVRSITGGNEIMAVDGLTAIARAFSDDGSRRRTDSQPNGFDIDLGTGDWRGATATTNRKIFVDNSGSVKFYDYSNTEQTGEALSLGVGSWQDVALIGTNRLGFLDRTTGAIRMYGTNRSRQAAEDIVLGGGRDYRSITANAAGTKIYVLVDGDDGALVWDVTDEEFKDAEAFDIITGTTNWQSIFTHPAGHLLAVHSTSTYAVALSLTGARQSSLDLRISVT